jgi:hypothetical protein
MLENIHLPAAPRALVTILEEEPATRNHETALLSEATLAADWDRTKEDEAWSHLHPER